MSAIDSVKVLQLIAMLSSYSGKAAYGIMKDMTSNPKKWEGRKVLFVHTGQKVYAIIWSYALFCN